MLKINMEYPEQMLVISVLESISQILSGKMSFFSLLPGITATLKPGCFIPAKF